jgi:hypothetical protein
MERPYTEEPVWADRVLTILAWRRFVLTGIVVAWILLAVLFFARPTPFSAEATLALPNTNDATAMLPSAIESTTRLKATLKSAKAMDVPFNVHLETSPRSSSDFSWSRAAGFPVASYKKLEKSLRDAGLYARLGGKLDAAEVGPLVPVTSAGRSDVQRLDKADAITGLAVSVSAGKGEAATEKAALFAELVRRVVLRNVSRDELQRLQIRANEQAQDGRKERIDLQYTNQSLAQTIADLEKLGRAGAAAGVSTLAGPSASAHRYLSPSVQILGLRAAMAENEHLMRVHDHHARMAALTLDFVRRAEARLDREFNGSGGFDPGALLRQEWELFNKDKDPQDAAIAAVAADVEGLSDALEGYGRSMYFLQAPGATQAARRRLPYVAAGLAAAFLVLALPILLEALRARQTAVRAAAA